MQIERFYFPWIEEPFLSSKMPASSPQCIALWKGVPKIFDKSQRQLQTTVFCPLSNNGAVLKMDTASNRPLKRQRFILSIRESWAMTMVRSDLRGNIGVWTGIFMTNRCRSIKDLGKSEDKNLKYRTKTRRWDGFLKYMRCSLLYTYSNAYVAPIVFESRKFYDIWAIERQKLAWLGGKELLVILMRDPMPALIQPWSRQSCNFCNFIGISLIITCKKTDDGMTERCRLE